MNHDCLSTSPILWRQRVHAVFIHYKELEGLVQFGAFLETCRLANLRSNWAGMSKTKSPTCVWPPSPFPHFSPKTWKILRLAWLVGVKCVLTQPDSVYFSNPFLKNSCKVLVGKVWTQKTSTQPGWHLVVLEQQGFSTGTVGHSKLEVFSFYRNNISLLVSVKKVEINYMHIFMLFCCFAMKHQLCLFICYPMHRASKKFYAKKPSNMQ